MKTKHLWNSDPEDCRTPPTQTLADGCHNRSTEGWEMSLRTQTEHVQIIIEKAHSTVPTLVAITTNLNLFNCS